MTAGILPQLDYAKPRRRRWRRWVGGAALLAVLAAAWYWHGPVERKARLLYWQRQCARYAAPADQVVVEQSAEGVTALQSSADYVAFLTPSDPVAVRVPPRCWAEYAPHLPTRNASATVLFLHERFNTRGERRLVVLEFVPHSWTALRGYVVTPAGLREGLTLNAELLSSGMGSVRRIGPVSRLRLYAGQTDANDRSRFTIRYDRDGKVGTIHGRLTDADGIDLEIGDGPLGGWKLSGRTWY